MFHNLSIRFKVTIINIAMIVGIVILGITGYWSNERILKSIRQQEKTVDVIENSLRLSGFVQQITYHFQSYNQALKTNDVGQIEKIRKDISTLIQTTQQTWREIEKKTTSHAFRDTKDKVGRSLDSFVKDTLQTITPQNNPKTPAQTASLLTTTQLQEDLSAFNTMIHQANDQSAKSTEETTILNGKNLFYTALISLILGIFVPLYLRYWLFIPLDKLLNVSSQINAGELSDEPPYLNQNDEIGHIAKGLDSLRFQMNESNQLRDMMNEVPLNIMIADPRNDFRIIYLNNASQSTLNRLHKHIPSASTNIMGSSIDMFHKDPQRIRSILSNPANLPHHARIKFGTDILDLQVSAIYDRDHQYIGALLCWKVATQGEKLAKDFEQSIGSVSNQIAKSSQNLELRSNALHGAINELSAAAREISQRIHDSLSVVQKAVNKGDDVRGHMSQLNDASHRINSVVTLIRSIAEKTNLLALNASIESARAGEAGKGFSVVANEVKNLANQTASAIVDIQNQISGMQDSAQGTYQTIQEMCEIIMSVNNIATDVASAIEEQRASTSEISRSIGQTSDQNDDPATGTISSMAHQLKATSQILLKECEAFLQKVHEI